MKVLLLAPEDTAARVWPILSGTEVELTDAPLKTRPTADLALSFGYRHIIPREFITDRMLNVHISLLPWNRGADPNFWSWFDHTPKGVTIHRIDAGIDTGPIVAQKPVKFGYGETLKSSYDRLIDVAVELLAEEWTWIRRGWYVASAQIPSGSFHRKKDLDPWKPYLTTGWDTPIYEIESLRERAA